ncbi:capsular polysaccharide export protein, LipB/KpsS family [Ferirhizobium litorale]|uniref:Glycosyltransferase n=1 Tax=Ferirhizobium litorale TaxID=2927786 RepID=A0AAE3QFL3_9HYPH|nr:glycosyltransferase [Fererhizobium litorale]MDI7922625.1 glycosyltransferase [Fererhizobium litorale]
MGFLASTHSWSEGLQSRSATMACLGYVYDDVSQYYMADYPGRLNQRLNSSDQLTSEQLARAQECIDRIVKQRVSKYNSQPIREFETDTAYPRRVLVCDQNYSDASTLFGRADEETFKRMLEAAIEENPDAEILVKTHPDIAWTKDSERRGFYDHMHDSGRVRVIRDAINPFCLFDVVDKVYVGTSGMGLEALLAGKHVVVFGAPFYAGWGLTDDRQAIPHRQRQRSLQELFHYFYIWYTIYNVPGARVPSEIEDALSYIERNRPTSLPIHVSAVSNPKVSVILPVYGVEAFVEEALRSIQRQSFQSVEILTINDQSPDGSQAIIDRLAALDERIRPIVLPENIGPGFARNVGLDAARGEFILFLDPDDYIPSTTHIEKLVACAEIDGADMVRGRKKLEQVEDAKGSVVRRRRDMTEQFFEEPFHAVRLSEEPRILHSRHFWNWMYRRDFLNKHDIRFLTTYREERAFVLKALLTAERLSGIDSDGVVYRIRSDSAVRREQTMADVFDQVSNFESIVDILEQFGAFEPESSLRHAASFQIAQFLHYLFLGFAYSTTRKVASDDERAVFFDRISEALIRSGFRASDLTNDPIQLSPPHVKARAYELLFEALCCKLYDYVPIAVGLMRVDQTILVEEFMREPQSARRHAFQSVLGLYARNDKVATAVGEDYTGTKPRLILHIGTTKTGSTFLQHFCEWNRARLLRMGIWFPEVGLFWQDARPHKQAGHSGFINAAATGDDKLRKHVEAGLRLASGRIHTVILSSEAFFLNWSAFDIPRYFDGYDVTIVGYFRRQDDWANSQYCEFVGGGALGKVSVPIEQWLKTDITRLRLDYRGYLDEWSRRLGEDRIVVRPYERDQLVDGDIVTDFFTTLGMTECLEAPRPVDLMRNEFALNESQLLLMRQFNELPFDGPKEYLAFVAKVQQGLAAMGGPSGRPNMLTTAQRKSILHRYASDTAYLARTYLKRDDGRFFTSERLPPESDIESLQIPLKQVSVFFRNYEVPKGKSPLANKAVTTIKAEWPLFKRARVTFNKIRHRKSIVFEKTVLGSNPFALPENIEKYCTIKKQWPRRKKVRVILKNIYLGRPILFP